MQQSLLCSMSTKPLGELKKIIKHFVKPRSPHCLGCAITLTRLIEKMTFVKPRPCHCFELALDSLGLVAKPIHCDCFDLTLIKRKT